MCVSFLQAEVEALSTSAGQQQSQAAAAQQQVTRLSQHLEQEQEALVKLAEELQVRCR